MKINSQKPNKSGAAGLEMVKKLFACTAAARSYRVFMNTESDDLETEKGK